MSNNVRTTAIEFANEIANVRNETQQHINMLNEFGMTTHHVNLPIALDESQQMLDRILAIVDSHNIAHRAHKCAVQLIDQWSNTSEILSSQMDEARRLKYDITNAKNRLYDLIQHVYKTSDTITMARDIYAASDRNYGKLMNQLNKIQQMHGQINDIYKTNVVPETDTVFNMIVDNHEKLRQDLANLIQLRSIVTDTNEHRARQIEAIREQWLHRTQEHSEQLMNKAREYVGLFQNTKNSAEVAMLARYVFTFFFSVAFLGKFFINRLFCIVSFSLSIRLLITVRLIKIFRNLFSQPPIYRIKHVKWLNKVKMTYIQKMMNQ